MKRLNIGMVKKKKINIDELYLVLICKIIDIKTDGDYINYGSKYVKFSVVFNEKGKYFKDLLSNEVYKVGLKRGYDVGTLFIDKTQYLIPLNVILKKEKKFIKEKDLIKILREPLINATQLLYSHDRDLIKYPNLIIKSFFETEPKQKQKKLKKEE